MKYRQLGRTALRVSELCLGTMNFGPRTPEKDSFKILDLALDSGINFIDTANQYGGSLGVGTTETIIGKWLAQDKTRRDQVVLATKVHEPMSDGVNDRGLSARHIQMACEASLKRLGIENIDLYQMHHIDRSAPIDEIWQALDNLVRQGKVTYTGSSNFPGWAIARANERAMSRGGLGLVAEQTLYNLLERRAELEVIPACLEYGLGLIPWSPLAGGLLAGRPTTEGRRMAALENASEKVKSQLGRFEQLSSGLGEPSSNVALAWLLHQPAIASVITGPGDANQLSEMLKVPDIELSHDVLAQIDEIFPPCGPAPEAYAW